VVLLLHHIADALKGEAFSYWLADGQQEWRDATFRENNTSPQVEAQRLLCVPEAELYRHLFSFAFLQ
jgi:hypothetical protein